MSTTPAPEPASAPAPEPAAAGPAREPGRDPAALIFDDPLGRQSSDDTDWGWGERPAGSRADDQARFLDEKPPHHI